MTMTRNDQQQVKLEIFAAVAEKFKHGTKIMNGAFEVTRLVTHASFVQVWVKHVADKGPSTCFTVRISGE